MTSAVYGRMRIGRCVKQDYGFMGCSADVLRYVDRLCSGRHACHFTVSDLHGNQPCPDDLTPFLEASYQCVPGISWLSRLSLAYTCRERKFGERPSTFSDLGGLVRLSLVWELRKLAHSIRFLSLKFNIYIISFYRSKNDKDV